MFSGKSLEGREGCAEQDGQGAGELDTDLRAGSVEKMEWVLEQLKQKSRQPLQLTYNAPEMGNVTLSPLALRTSELDPSLAASGATAEVRLELSLDFTTPDLSISV